MLNKKSFEEKAGIREDDFIKISLSPDNELVPDLYNSLPGTSIWVPANKGQLKDILRKEELSAHFGVSKIFTQDLNSLIEKILRKKILNIKAYFIPHPAMHRRQ